MLSLKTKVTLERLEKAVQTNIEWARQERKMATDLARNEQSVQKNVYEGHAEALSEIEKQLSSADIKAKELVARRDARIDEALAIILQLKTDLVEHKSEIDKIYQLDMNNWRVLGKSEMYQKINTAVDHLLNELKSANAP
jgi:hypothetical protein